MSPDYKYRAFISYSHRDKEWGEWIHSNLERYRVPRALVGRDTDLGPIPSSLRPIFRDREDLSAAHSIDARLTAALAASSHLVVLCSPGAVKSPAVNEEVRQFKAAGRGDRILPVIVGGEPHDPENECFPRALLNKVDSEGRVTDERDIEPIAADARPEGDGRELAKLKLVGGLLGVELDEIRRRDLAEQQRQKRLWQGISVAMSVLAVAAAASGYSWRMERNEKAALLDRTRAHLETSLEQSAEIVEKVAGTNEEWGVPLHVVQEFMDDTHVFISDAESFLQQVQQLGEVKHELKLAQARTLLNFARTAAKMQEKAGQAEQLARAAFSIFDELVSQPGPPLDWQQDRSEAQIEIGRSLLTQNKVDDALAEFGKACASKEGIVRDMPHEPPRWFTWRRGLASCHVNTGLAHLRRNAVGPAMAAFDRAMVVLHDLLAEKPDDPESALLAMDALRMRTDGYRQEDDFTAALAAAAEGTAIGERAAFGKSVASIKLRRGLALVMLERGDVLSDLGKHAEALQNYEPASQTFGELAAKDPKNIKTRNSYAWSLVNLGNARVGLGDNIGGWRSFAKAGQIYEELIAEQPQDTRWKSNYGHVLDGFAEIHDREGRIDEAMAVRKRQEALYDAAKLVPNLAQVRFAIADLHSAKGEHREALAALTLALSARRQLLEKDPAESGRRNGVAVTLARIGECNLQIGDLDAAGTALLESHAIRVAMLAESSLLADRQAALGESHMRLARLAEAQNKPAEARAQLVRADELFGKALDQTVRGSWQNSRDKVRSALERLGAEKAESGAGSAADPALR